MKHLMTYQKKHDPLIDYVPDSEKTQAQLDYIDLVLNYIRRNRQEYLETLSQWELKDIEQAIEDFSLVAENLRMHKEFSIVEIFKEKISIYKISKERMLKSIAARLN